MIILYYIEGIDRENIPYVYPKYKTQTTISDYLREHEVATIPNSYYPPYYRNIISISSEDFTGNFLETSINYLGIVFGNKTYYYFIDRIEYVNEDLYKLHVTMDVIMTYINEIKIHGGIIERKFIDRYDSNNKINRNYLRENIGSDLFNLSYRKYYNNRKDFSLDDIGIDGLFIFKLTTSPFMTTQDITNRTIVNTDKQHYITSYYTLLLPVSNELKYDTDLIMGENYGTVHTSGNINKLYKILDKIINLTEVIECKYTPIVNFKGLEGRYDNVRNEYTITSTDKHIPVAFKTDDKTIDYGFSLNEVTCTPLRAIISLDYKKNSSKNVVFSSDYVPALLDENYKRIAFGDGEVQSTPNLYPITSRTLYLDYFFDITSGSRYYNIITDVINAPDISTKNNYGSNNSLQALKVNTEYVSFDLINNEWNNWKAYNSATIGFGIADSILDVASFATGAYGAYNTFQKGMSKLYTNKRFLDKRYKDPVLNKRGLARKENLEKMPYEVAEEGIGTISKIPGRFENAINASKAPSTVKSGGNFTFVINSESYNIRYDEYIVNNYEQCAQYYHRNGYLVDEYINEVDSIFDYVSTRYYYNILKMRDVDISLVNSPASTEILELIAERLENGIRLWNCDHQRTFVNIGDYKFDNVERSYLNE